MKKLVTYLFLFYSINLYAFDWSKCNRYIKRVDHLGSPLLSTSSFFTSTGDCAMIGKVKYDRKVFMSYNFDKVQIDAARGSGEYLSVMASLYSCESEDVERFSRLMQKNYKEIFSSGDSRKTLDEMSKTVINSRGEVGACKV